MKACCGFVSPYFEPERMCSIQDSANCESLELAEYAGLGLTESLNFYRSLLRTDEGSTNATSWNTGFEKGDLRMISLE